jgi:hypothetical protein
MGHFSVAIIILGEVKHPHLPHLGFFSFIKNSHSLQVLIRCEICSAFETINPDVAHLATDEPKDIAFWAKQGPQLCIVVIITDYLEADQDGSKDL